MAEKTTYTERKDYDDGSFDEIEVEEVEGGFIQTISRHFKKGDSWEYETKKSVHTSNPLKKKSLADKLDKEYNENGLEMM